MRYLSQLKLYNSQVTGYSYVKSCLLRAILFEQKQNCKRLFKHVQAVMMSIAEVSLLFMHDALLYKHINKQFIKLV